MVAKSQLLILQDVVVGGSCLSLYLCKQVDRGISLFFFDSVSFPHLPRSGSGVFSSITLTLLPPVTVVFSRV